MQREGRIDGQSAVLNLSQRLYAPIPSDACLIRVDGPDGVIGYHDSAGKAHDLTWLPVPQTAKIEFQDGF